MLIRSADGTVELSGYRAFNLIGLVAATDVPRTRFAPGADSRALDASIDALAIDPARIPGLLMFRLAENTSAIVVYRSIKTAVEAAWSCPDFADTLPLAKGVPNAQSQATLPASLS